MRVNYFILLIFMEILQIFCDEDEHVHLKIYVPEIIKHNIHTKTIFIHVKIPKKKKKHGHLETYHENWNNWNAYNHGSYHQIGEKEKAQKNHMNNFFPLYNNINNQDQNKGQGYDPRIPFYDDYKEDSGSVEDSPSPPKNQVHSKLKFESGVTGYSYPPQYETHEDVDDISPNDIGSYEHSEYNKGGRMQGHQIEGGHLHTDLTNSYYNSKIEESSEQKGGSSSESYSFPGNNYMTNMLAG